MILISVLYQNASTSRILEPSPQGLISSIPKREFLLVICFFELSILFLVSSTDVKKYFKYSDEYWKCHITQFLMQTILHVEKIGQVSSFFSRLMPTEFCFPPSFLMEKLFNPCVIRGTCLLTTTKETRKLPTYQF